MRRSGPVRRYPSPERASLFSRVFGIDDPESKPWFDPLLIRDNPVFVDPFLLPLTQEPEFRGASEELFNHFKRLYVAVANDPKAKVEQVLRFPEVAETCLGYTVSGTRGSGSGQSRAVEMRSAIGAAIEAGLSSPDHFEEIGLLAEGIGPDLISDITTRILIARFMNYTERVARDHGLETFEYRLEGYEVQDGVVVPMQYVRRLPRNPHALNLQGILLVPKLILRQIPTINRGQFLDYLFKVHMDELIGRFNIAVKKDIRALVLEIARQRPDWVRDYTKWEESRPYRPYEFGSDPAAVGRTYRAFYEVGLTAPDPPSVPTSASEVRDLVRYLARNFKDYIEKTDGFKFLWDDGYKKPKTEEAVQRLFTATARGVCEIVGVRMTRESDAGTGPVDFLFTKGYKETALLETKLISNGTYWNGLNAQLPEYMRSNDASSGMFVGVAFSERDIKSERYTALTEIANRVGRELKIEIDAERVDARPRLTPPSKMKGTIRPPDKG